MLRLKTTVQQVRTSCANDVRKRDKEIQRLKGHLQQQQRGNRSGLTGASITITPGSTGINGMSGTRDDGPDIDDPEYSLRQETTEFLTQLSQSLSDENDNLIGLVRSTLVTLRELQGMPEVRHDERPDLSIIGEEESEDTEQGMMQGLPTSYEKLAGDMDAVLENLKTLLTNPNFVSVDEVEMREEEIAKLRAGWDKMESRWRDTLALMDGWRKRMAEGGDTINLEDLTRGLHLSVGLSADNSADVSVIAEEEEEGDEEEEAFSEQEDLDEPSPVEAEVPERTSKSSSFKSKLQRDSPALREASGNRYQVPTKSPRKVAFSASTPNTPASDIDNENASTDVSEVKAASATKLRRTPLSSVASTARSSPVAAPASDERVPKAPSSIPRKVRLSNSTMDIADQLEQLAGIVTNPSLTPSPSTSPERSASASASPSPSPPHSAALALLSDLSLTSDNDSQTKRRHSSPRTHPEERSPKLTVNEKLKQAEAEASAIPSPAKSRARARSDVGRERAGSVSKIPALAGEQQGSGSPKKTRIAGRARRRKSTLTPEELQGLLGLE